jgi:hypothetical protein
MDSNNRYTYESAGFTPYLRRPLGTAVGQQGLARTTLPIARNYNFDQAQVTGSLGDKLSIGKIVLNGSDGKISVFDDEGNEVITIGELDG